MLMYSWRFQQSERVLIAALPLEGPVTLGKPFLPHRGFLIHRVGIMLGLPTLVGNK